MPASPISATDKTTMIDRALKARGIRDARVLEAFERVPRERFVPDSVSDLAYVDQPLPIGRGQTISQPYVVAYMLQELELAPEHRVFEAGSGSGYVVALLACLCKEVVGAEVVGELFERSVKTLAALKRERPFRGDYRVEHGPAAEIMARYGPFDRILVSAAAPALPEELFAQLREGGIMVIPIGTDDQWLQKIVKVNGRPVREDLLPVRFVPLLP